MKLGELVNYLMKRGRYTKEDMCKISGVKEEKIQSLIGGDEPKLDIEEIMRIAYVFRLSWIFLIHSTNYKPEYMIINEEPSANFDRQALSILPLINSTLNSADSNKFAFPHVMRFVENHHQKLTTEDFGVGMLEKRNKLTKLLEPHLEKITKYNEKLPSNEIVNIDEIIRVTDIVLNFLEIKGAPTVGIAGCGRFDQDPSAEDYNKFDHGKLDPLCHILQVMGGVIMMPCDIGTIHGLTIRLQEGLNYIFINRHLRKHRQRSTYYHEISHILLEHPSFFDLNKNAIVCENYYVYETQAWYLAIELMMPAKFIKKNLEEGIWDYEILARKFGVHKLQMIGKLLRLSQTEEFSFMRENKEWKRFYDSILNTPLLWDCVNEFFNERSTFEFRRDDGTCSGTCGGRSKGAVCRKNITNTLTTKYFIDIGPEQEQLKNKNIELRKGLLRYLPHKTTFRVSICFVSLFLFAFFADMLGVQIIKPFWNIIGISISGGFLVMAYFLFLDWKKHNANGTDT